MSYLLLFAAIGCEVFATTCMKYAEGFSKLLPSLASLIAYAASCYLLSRVLLKLNLAVVYATWCGVGIAATALISWFVFGEKLNLIGVLSLILIAAGVVLLNCFGTAS